MSPTPAFTTPAPATTFTSSRAAVTSSRPPLRVATRPSVASVSMQWNPFAKKPEQSTDAETSFMSPQPGEPGSAPLPKDSAASKSPAKAANDLPVFAGDDDSRIKRGLDLLKEDLLKNAPERAGVGRQDRDALTMKPVAGEPGYKPPSIATVKVSALGISPFSDDKNYVSNVGGVEAVKQAAIDSKAGKSAKQIKKEVMDAVNKENSMVVKDKFTEMKTFKPPTSTPSAFTPTPVPATPKTTDDLLPSYLRPIPEDTPRKGMTWKNYEGR